MPYAIWIAARSSVTEYHALLLSTVPGFAYTISRFAKERSWNVTGLFLIAALLVGTLVDVLSGDAETMIRNNIRMLLVFGLCFLASIMVNRPLALYFFADTMAVLGLHPQRGKAAETYRRKEWMPYFQALTLLFVLRYATIAAAKTVMFSSYGVSGYGLLIWWRVGLSWGFGAAILLASLYVAGKVRERAE